MRARQHLPAINPVAAINPGTGLPFDGKLVLRVSRTLCFDNDPAVPWDHEYPLAKTALSPALKEQRLKWAKKVIAMELTARFLGKSMDLSKNQKWLLGLRPPPPCRPHARRRPVSSQASPQ